MRTPFEKDKVFVVVGVMGVVILVGVSVSFSGDFVVALGVVLLLLIVVVGVMSMALTSRVSKKRKKKTILKKKVSFLGLGFLWRLELHKISHFHELKFGPASSASADAADFVIVVVMGGTILYDGN